MENHNSGMTFIEALGCCAIVMTLSILAMSGARDAATSSRKAQLAHESKILNTGWQNLQSAGGPKNAYTAQEAVQLMVNGIPLGGTTYRPLSSMPALEAEVGGKNYTLNFDPDSGFEYAEASSGPLQMLESVPSDQAKELAIDSTIADMRIVPWSSSEYASGLGELNGMMATGTLEFQQWAQQLEAIGVVLSDDGLAISSASREELANQAAALLHAGVPWSDLSIELQSALTEYGPDEQQASGDQH